jgi:hypothetical protein
LIKSVQLLSYGDLVKLAEHHLFASSEDFDGFILNATKETNLWNLTDHIKEKSNVFERLVGIRAAMVCNINEIYAPANILHLLATSTQ